MLKRLKVIDLCLYTLTIFLIFDLASTYNVTSNWGKCSRDRSSRDRNCVGEKKRTVKIFNDTTDKEILRETEYEACLLTTETIDGGYTNWERWEDCSWRCSGPTIRRRYCNDPTPCNGGRDCSHFGADELTKQCGPVDGLWANWEEWGDCITSDPTTIYGNGYHERARDCDDPKPACGGEDCIGFANETGFCREIPPCLSSRIFEEKYFKQENPMIIYTSAQVEIYPLTKNKCTMETIIYNFWNLYKVNETTGSETYVAGPLSTLKFKISAGQYDVGLYRLYTKIGYPRSMDHWMEESMYFRIMHPPPHAFINGGSGKTVGKGLLPIDARSVSYSLTKGPGDPSGLSFKWECSNFITKTLYKLLQLYINPSMVFVEETGNEKKWYRTGFTEHIEEKVAWINASKLYDRIKYHRENQSSCLTADQVTVNVKYGSYRDPPPISNNTGNSTDMYEVPTTVSYASIPSFEWLPLTKFFDIETMKDIDNYTANYDSDSVLAFPTYNELVTNELFTFIDFYYGVNGSSFPTDTMDFFQTLSESFLTLQSVSRLEGLNGLPSSASTDFFNNLTSWLNDAVHGLDFSKLAAPLLTGYIDKSKYIGNATELLKYIDVDSFMRLMVDDSGTCLSDFLGVLFEGYFIINQYDWFSMKNTERYYMEWITDELFSSSACSLFTGYENGTGDLMVTENDATEGMGFLINVRVEFEGSVSYFVQHVQAVLGTPPELEIECRLNCMKKTAVTSILSLKAACVSCTADQLTGSRFWWNIKNFDIYTRTSSDNTEWPNWMLSEPNTQKFVMAANVLNESSGYLIEAVFETETGEIGTAIWSVTTNILPYGGICEIENAIWGEKKVTTSGWKDEGFRNLQDASLDWKEQLNFRIVQPESDGKEIMLYYGSEEENYIRVKPGIPELDFIVTVKVQIFDIFVDYAECTYNLGRIFPSFKRGNSASVRNYVTKYTKDIDYYWKSGNMKQVAMNAEVASTSVEDLEIPETLFDTDPGDWVNLGTETLSDGSTVKKSFEELLDMYYYSDTGDTASNADIVDKLTSFVDTLDLATDEIDSGTTVNIGQMVKSIGTTVVNKKFVSKNSASSAFKGNSKLLDKLVDLTNNETYPKYEDFIETCKGALRVLNNALEGILPKTSVETPSQLDIYSVQKTIHDRGKFKETEDTDLTAMEKAYIASEISAKNELEIKKRNDVVKNEVPGLLKAIRKLGKVLHQLNHRKQMPVYVQNAHINSTRDKKYRNELLNKGFKHDKVGVDFKESEGQSAEELEVQVTLYDHTPFSWDNDSKYINSKTVTISVGEDNTNSVIPSKINIPNLDQTQSTKSVNLAVPADRNEPTLQMLVYKMYWKNYEDSLIFYVRNALDYMNHVIYVRAKEHPTETDYDWIKTVETDDWMSGDEIKVIISGGLYTKETVVHIGVQVSHTSTETTTSEPNRRRKRAAISDTLLNTTMTCGNDTLLNTTTFSGNDTSLNTTVICNNDTTSSTIPETLLVAYHIVGATTGCRVWDDINQRWNKTSCKVSSASTVNDTVCECDNPPGNNFATTFYVPPNTIDFGTVFGKFDLANNAAVFATVICLLVLYALICVWAFRQDKKDFSRWALSYLVDNSPTDDYLYILTVYTGLHRQAGTKSNISFFIMDGSKMNIHMCARRLDDVSHMGFGVGSVRRFVMSTTTRIEDPSVLRIWHDNSGPGDSASWYLNKVILEDVQTQDRFLFVCDQWLSLDHDDGTVECTIPVSDKKDRTKFSYLFNEKTRENTTDSHLWLSIAIRPEESHFTRIQRLSCCLTYLFLAMISNAMFFGQDTGNKISLGPITFSLSGIYISFISALIAAPAIFFVTYLFRNSRPGYRPLKSQNDKNRKQLQTPDLNAYNNDVYTYSERSLPFWCKYIAWTIVTIAILASGFFLILYSMEWGKSKSEEWLLCFFMSFFQSLLIIDPLKIILISIILSWIIKRHKEKSVTYDVDKLLAETKQRAATRVLSFDDDFPRPRVAPLKPSKVNKLKERRKITLRAQKTLFEVIMYLIFLTFMYIVSFSNRDPGWSNLTQHLDNQLISVPEVVSGNTSLRFSQVQSAHDLYKWLDETLIRFLFPINHVNGNRMKSYQRLYVKDLVNFRLGAMRLRQVRTKEETCTVNLWNHSVCYDQYSVLDEDETNYCVGWQNGPCPSDQAVNNKTSPAWMFVSSIDVWGLPVTGYHSTYGGGGYIAEFVVNYNISKMIIDNLYKYVWIDRKTRAVFSEFTLYNVDDNVFVYCSFLCEFLETGGVLTSSSVKPFRPYQHVGSYGVVVLVCELVVLVSMAIFVVRKVLMLRRHGRKIFREVWNVLDLCIIVLFIACTAMYIGRWIIIDQAIDKFQDNINKFVNFDHIATWDELFNIMLAFIIFLTTLRIMRVLSYSERINQLGHVLSSVSRDLAGCFLMFLIIYTAFVMFGHLIFGRQLETYKNLLVSSTTLTNAVIGKNSINDLFDVEPALGRAYYFFFVLFLLWVLMTMLNATLNVGITRVRQKMVKVPPTYGIMNILMNMWKGTVGMFLKSNNHFTANKKKTMQKYATNMPQETQNKKRRPKTIYQ